MIEIIQRNHIQVSGKGEQVVLFAHGFGCDKNAWRYLTPYFSDQYKLVVFDYVGAGLSNLDNYDFKRYSSLDGYAKDVIEICQAMQFKDVIFVGHSVSCMIGALVSIKKPDLFSKMIFIGPSPCYINDGEYIGGFDKETIDGLLGVLEEDYIGWSRSLAPQIMGNENGEALGMELGDSFCRVDPEIAKQFARVTFTGDNRTDLPNITVPSLTVQCSVDMIAPITVGEYINANTQQNELVVLEAHGHCPHMSHPRQTAAAIMAFLN